MVKEGKFHQDFYTNNTVEVHIPPLADRVDDICDEATTSGSLFTEILKRSLSIAPDAVTN